MPPVGHDYDTARVIQPSFLVMSKARSVGGGWVELSAAAPLPLQPPEVANDSSSVQLA